MCATLAHVPARHPKPEEGVSQSNTDVDVANSARAPRQEGPQVVHLGLEPRQPWPALVGGKLRFRGFGERQKILGVATPDRRSFSARVEALTRVLANRLE